MGQLVTQAAAYRGQVVNASGTFAGWTGPCRGAPPRRRSDWMLVDGTACLYVSGPLPAGITAPPDAASMGRPVRVRGQLLFSDDGRPYLLQASP